MFSIICLYDFCLFVFLSDFCSIGHASLSAIAFSFQQWNIFWLKVFFGDENDEKSFLSNLTL
jgi:hypothetical protein